MTYLEALEPYIDRIDNLTKQNEHLRQKLAVLELRFEEMKNCCNCEDCSFYINQKCEYKNS